MNVLQSKAERLFNWLLAAGLFVLVVAIVIPNFTKARYVSHSFLTFDVRVTDRETGLPISNAKAVILPTAQHSDRTHLLGESTVDTNGICQLKSNFRATGEEGGLGEFAVGNVVLLVTAPGYKRFDSPVRSFTGEKWRYHKVAPAVVCKVAMERSR